MTEETHKMTQLVTREAPDFTADVVMPDNTFGQFKMSEQRGRYTVLFFYPLDFTFVCPSEIIAFDKALPEFRQRNCDVVSISIDSKFSHLAWKNTPIEHGGIGNVQFPMIADITKSISRDYGVLFNDAIALRGLFLIDRNGVIRHSVVNDLPLGRSVEEVLRMVDALQFFEKHGEVCPANWKPGKQAMKPSAEGVREYLKANA